MATYRAIAASETDPDSPVTSTLMVALAENPVAIAEGATGAPRVSPKAQGYTVITGTSAAGTLTLSGFGLYGGTTLQVYGDNSAGSDFLEVLISDDNITYYGPLPLTVSGTGETAATATIDFATGGVASATHNAILSGTIAGFSGAITHIRVRQAGAGTIAFGVMATVNGGIIA